MPAFPYLFANTFFPINLTTIAMMVFAGLVVLIALRIAVRKLDMHPRGFQNVMEWAVEFTATMAKDTMPNEQVVQWIMPLAFTMLIFLFVSNWLGLIATVAIHLHHPVPALGITAEKLSESKGEVMLFDSPTANMSMTLGLAVMVWIIAHARGLRHPKIWLKHFVSPSPLAILEEITNPLTHGMRLYGNIFAGEALIGIFLGIPYLFGWVPTGLPLLLVWLFYSGFVSTIQAYVFSILMCLYIGNKSFEGQTH
ncbi:F0F1 ATP synthase subunit A [Alicyclobacillus cycloheptanicus]|uniref:ATP synthase subunit a n=1 Tax=Alicyclobacillus cycloheptanicus TaxID=1457 RepID=A0ABT9XH42_9BACL|nr:F0F1 ATP synthase subunit A [Alicyclobacillus cycloheptanicus]MDQ0189425.1 F-type H+-transporting ATPase subunit a [Alicyclobacillus cycloheptanicus]WDM02296.1 F0F1 ATP synthase subunit A [Alicyclobacillus cycloheptanicus]